MPTPSGLSLFFLLFTITTAASALDLKSYSASYKVSASGLDLGKLTVNLEITDGKYHYKKSTDASGLMKWISNDQLKESSEGVIGANEPAPKTYHYLHTRKKGTKEEQAEFNENAVTGHYNNKPFSYPLSSSLQDKASQDILLMREVASGKKEISMSVIDKGKIRKQEYLVEGREMIEISGKEYETIKLIVKRKRSKRVTRFWLAPELHYIPVQFTHKDGEDKPTVQSKLVKLKMN